MIHQVFEAGGSDIVTTGALTSGSIAYGFGNIDVGTNEISAGKADIDDIVIDGAKAGTVERQT